MEPPAPSPKSTATSGCRESRRASIILDRYKLGRQLGRGSFAKVYLAKSLIDDSSVAVKIIDKPECVEMQSRITREISAMRRLQNHPHILKIHEVMATKSKIYLVMELAKGGELFAKIASRGRLTESAARNYFQQLVSALDFCHLNGVAHRDVKPQNLLLDQNNNLKVSDFGLSALPEQIMDGLLRTACGTPAYTAPEVACRRNGGYDGSKADAWSCGILLYFFLAGYLPFDYTNMIEMYQKIHRREYTFPEWISRPVKRIIWHLLDPNPNTRLSIELLKSTTWFKKSPQPDQKTTLFECDPFFEKTYISRPINAFDIISMSSGLDLSGLFEAGCTKERRRRFTSAAKCDVILKKVCEVGGGLGLDVAKGKNRAIEVNPGRLGMRVEVMEVATEMMMVEVKIEVGVADRFEEARWVEFKAGLNEIVLAWHDEPA
ncbi:unnamed protein product [Rhodiola kirilowii]